MMTAPFSFLRFILVPFLAFGIACGGGSAVPDTAEPLPQETSPALTPIPPAAQDQRYFLAPIDLQPGQIVCHDDDRHLVADADRPEYRSDEQMQLVGGCRDPQLNLYAVEEQNGGEARPGRVYVKTQEGQYLRLRPH